MLRRLSLKRLRGNERGAVSIFVAIGMVVFLGSAAIAIDLGHLMNVRTESQRVADLSALAGASAFVDASNSPALQSTIEQRAIDYGGRNTVDRTSVALTPSDIQIDFTNERVRVTVQHTGATGNPIQTIFARILGINDVDVVTTAVAEAFPAAGAKCILPFMLPDKYNDANNNDEWDAPPDTYIQFDPNNQPQSPPATGYTNADIGTLIIIKPSQGNNGDKANPSWYYPIVVYGPGGSNYRDAIAGCVDESIVLAIGDQVDTEPGAMVGPTRQGVNALVAQAPNHQWSDPNQCVVDGGPNGDPNVCVASPRVRPVPMMAPYDAPANGRKKVPITNWAGLFIEGMQGNNVLARFVGYSGFAVASPSGGGSAALPKLIRLVE